MIIYKFKFRYVLSDGAIGTGTVYSFSTTVKGVERSARVRYHLDDDAKIFDIEEVGRCSYGNRRP